MTAELTRRLAAPGLCLAAGYAFSVYYAHNFTPVEYAFSKQGFLAGLVALFFKWAPANFLMGGWLFLPVGLIAGRIIRRVVTDRSARSRLAIGLLAGVLAAFALSYLTVLQLLCLEDGVISAIVNVREGLRGATILTPYFAVASVPLMVVLYSKTVLLAKTPAQLSASTTRRLRLLRAHGLITKLTGTHRYQLTQKGRLVISALLTAHNSSAQALTKLVA